MNRNGTDHRDDQGRRRRVIKSFTAPTSVSGRRWRVTQDQPGHVGSVHVRYPYEVAAHKFQDLKGVTFDEEVDEVTGQSRWVVRLARRKEAAASSKFRKQQDGQDLPDASAGEPDGDRRRRC